MYVYVYCHNLCRGDLSADHMLVQHVDTFVSEMARAEKDKRKRRKLDDLQLTADEWARVKQCLDLLAVCSICSMLSWLAFTSLITYNSMPTTHSRHSRRIAVPACILRCLLLRHFNVHGARVQGSPSTPNFNQRLKRGARRSPSTTRRRQKHRCTHSRFVSGQ